MEGENTTSALARYPEMKFFLWSASQARLVARYDVTSRVRIYLTDYTQDYNQESRSEYGLSAFKILSKHNCIGDRCSPAVIYGVQRHC